MKNALLLFFLFIAVNLSAQHQKGSVYLDGATSAGLRHSVDDGPGRRLVGAASNRLGYFFTDRLLVGTRISYFETEPDAFFNVEDATLEFRPFARYYFPIRGLDKMHFFGELGFGRFRPIGNGDSYETDFFLGAGAEREIAPGILGTAALRYDAFASGLNFTNLDLGLNILLGQLDNAGSAVFLSAGTFSADARFGSIRYGRMTSGSETSTQTDISLNPRIGYFVLDGLLLEVNAGLQYTSGDTQFGLFGQDINTEFTQYNVGIGTRYYPIKSGRLLPFVTADASFNSTNHLSFFSNRGVNERFNSIIYRAGVGTSYFLSPNLALEGSIRYEVDDVIQTSAINNLPINNFQTLRSTKYVAAQIGLRVYLPGR